MKWNVIGISGATCSGKTTLTERLKENLPGQVVTMNQDIYFWPEDSKNHLWDEELQHNNYDFVSSVNFAQLLEDAKLIVKKEPESGVGFLIIEGILVLNYRPIEKMCQRKFFLTLPRDECLRRRLERTYDPPDTPGYFDKCVWPMYDMNLAEIKKNVPDIVYVDGTKTQDEIYRLVFNDLSSDATR